MSTPTVLVHRDPQQLVAAVAARLVTRLVDVQAARGSASVVLTGGGTGIGVLSSLAASPARDAVDWEHLDVWWGDERFLPEGDPERNETQAREALLDHVDVDPARVFPMAPRSDDVPDPETSAARYTEALAAAARPEDHGPVPRFDVLLLGVGPDGHIASLFPEHPGLQDERPALAVHGSPKPPPLRVSLSFPTLRAATEVWFVAAGEEKAGAIRMALSGAGERQVPAAGVQGRARTLWLLDRAAAGRLPQSLGRIASP